MEKIKNLFEEPKVMKENFCQNDFISKNDSFTQIEIEEDVKFFFFIISLIKF